MHDIYNAKWEKGKKITLLHYRRKLPWKNKRYNRELHLPAYFKKLIGDKKEVRIAELGSGMFCTIGSLWKTAKVKVYPSDTLADEFNQILKKARVTPLIPVRREDMSNLSYPDSFFDIVHCVNALDHTTNPLRAIREMYRVCKPGGFIYLRHFVNVGINENYFGLHLWNIDSYNDADCIIWNPEKKFILSDIFREFKTVKKEFIDVIGEKTDVMVISILHKEL